MSSAESSDSQEHQECILKCKGAKHFYTLPKKAYMRSLWIYKLHIDGEEYYPNPFVCDKHFSEKMFSSPNKLTAIAVPDMNLPSELDSNKGTKVLSPTKSRQKRTELRKPQVNNVQSKSSLPITQAAPKIMNNNSKPVSKSTQNWINDSSNLLVDYQLKVQGKHLCDVIEIPQYIVVFTVVKNKKNKRIQSNDKRAIKSVKVAKPPVHITETITIDDDDYDEMPRIISSIPANKTIANPPAVEKPIVSEVIQLKPSISLPKPKKPEPEIDIVYYTTEEAAPRRDRALQVDFSSNQIETGIQCDFQLEHDLLEMSYNAELYWAQSRLKDKNPQMNMDECLACGEIVKSKALKARHAQGHEIRSSMCCQCGVMFDNPIKLKDHEKNVHSNSFCGSKKPQRCPKINCNKAFISKKRLNRHIQEHVEAKQHKCNKCSEYFSSAMKLICHQKALDKCLRTRGWTSRRWSKRV
ncbi:uncharacterized protein LOC129920737 [Episyrphus balteatus]|uniref:uncharacterized protein LOC129920737 n=1 Tax=Episyrphus balteatus TaxID=286459 RepID=UPI0024865D7B|nr:uncharacterized protein LOC129920737 [Episyrphus balteatus]